MKFSDIKFENRPELFGVQGFVALNNGYRLSVVQNGFSYGADRGLWEIGLMDPAGDLKHVEEWGDQVKGYLTEKQVEEEIEWLNNEHLQD